LNNKDKYDPLTNPNPSWMKEAESAGKGDKARKVDSDKYRSNYDKIFKKKKDEEKS